MQLTLPILLVGLFSGFVQGLSGFAFGLVAASLWAWMMEPQQVVPMVVLGSLLGQCISILSVRQHIQLRRVVPFCIGSVPGVPVGASILGALNASVFRFAVGCGLVVFCSLMLCASRLPKIRANATADGCIGFASGALTGACGMGGPPVTLWCALRDWEVAVQRATYQCFFIVMQVQVLVVFAWHGIVNAPLLQAFLGLAPAVVIGSWTGAQLSRRFSANQFRRLIFTLLLFAGLMLSLPEVIRFAGSGHQAAAGSPTGSLSG